jgi:vacuolar-type H+-ATPase catalytic subunit A/Vma1
LLLEAARIVRETVLGQSAYDPNDAASPVEKTYRLALLADALYRTALAALDAGVAFESLDITTVGRTLAALRRAPPEDLADRAAAAEAAIAGLGPVAAGTR